MTATTAHGTLRVGDVARGSVQLETATGAIEVGIRQGTAAWLDVSSGSGQVRNTLTTSDAPERPRTPSTSEPAPATETSTSAAPDPDRHAIAVAGM